MTEPRTRLDRVALESICDEVRKEVIRARMKHAPMHSAHEGYAVILEEMDELWEEVKRQEIDRSAMRDEALQVAAMAVAFILEATDD